MFVTLVVTWTSRDRPGLVLFLGGSLMLLMGLSRLVRCTWRSQAKLGLVREKCLPAVLRAVEASYVPFVLLL